MMSSTPLSPEQLAQSPNFTVLSGKNVLITGGASGLGAAVAKRFAEHGAHVTIADIQVEKGEAYANTLSGQGLSVSFVRTDVTSWPSLNASFRQALKSSSNHTLDIVVGAAGVAGGPFMTPADEPLSLDKDPPAPLSSPIDVNVTGLLYTAKAAQLYLSYQTKERPETQTDMKSLVLLGSLGGYMEIPLLANYNASKWGVRGLFRTLREPLLGSNIRLNLIAPWIMDTPMSQVEVAMFKSVDVPIGRIEDVVDAVGHCVTDDRITGRSFAVGPHRILDLKDDAEGTDAAEAMRGFWENELPGFAAAMERLMKQGPPPA